MKIGLVPGSFKPYHAGHDALVRMAAAENDSVLVFSSTADRLRKGEMPLYGADMQQIIDKFVRPSLPGNVQMIDVGVPVAAVWQELEKAEKAKSKDTFTVYSDSEDIQKYSEKSLMKYAPRLQSKGQIITRGVTRGQETPDISGTMMRAYLEAGDVKNFAKMLPPSVKKYSKEIIDILKAKKKTATTESLLRRYVSLVLAG